MPSIQPTVTSPTLTPPLEHPFARFNRNLDGLNPDLDSQCFGEKADLLPPNPELDQLQKNALGRLEWIIDPQSRQIYTCLKFNWNYVSTETQALVVLLPYSVSTESAEYLIEQIVRQADGQPVIVVNNPGFCGSRRQSKRIRRNTSKGRFAGIAESLLRALTNDGLRHIVVAGFSMGGRLALALGEASTHSHNALSARIHCVIALDSPGFENFSFMDFTDRFGNVEGARMATYQNTSHDPVIRDRGGKPKPIRQAILFFWALRHDLLGNLALMNGLRTESASRDVSALSRSGVDTYLIRGTESAISTKHPELPKGIKLILLAGDTHAFGEECRRLAWYITHFALRRGA